MVAAPLVDAATLASWLGLEFDEEDESRAETVIQMVSGFARAEASSDWTIQDVPEDVALVVLMAAVRLWSNPDMKTSVTHDDVTRRWESGKVFDDSQLRVLRKYRPSAGGGLSTVQFTTPSAQVGHGVVSYQVQKDRKSVV